MGNNSLLGNIIRGVVGAATMGSSELFLSGARTVSDPGGVKNAMSNNQTLQSTNLQQQKDIAAREQTQLLERPKSISPDNFLASKAAQLANLRMGIASTITGGGNQSGVLPKAGSLTSDFPGKTKLGQ